MTGTNYYGYIEKGNMNSKWSSVGHFQVGINWGWRRKSRYILKFRVEARTLQEEGTAWERAPGLKGGKKEINVILREWQTVVARKKKKNLLTGGDDWISFHCLCNERLSSVWQDLLREA